MKPLLFACSLILAACSGGSSSSGPSTPQPPPPEPGACIKTGCSGTVCAEPGQEVVTTCEYKPEYICYQQATCERQPGGACGWTQTAELSACLASPPSS